MNKLMRLFTFVSLLFCLPAVSQQKGLLQTGNSPFIKLKNTNIGDVKWTTGFWADRVEMCERVVTPYMRTIYMNGALNNFKVAAGMQEGEFRGAWWHDGDFYKWLEALTISYADTRDKNIDRQIDSIVAIVAAAQQPDGYINTATQIGHGVGTFAFTREQPFTNKKKWESDRELEVYNMGHLLTAAAIHYRVTGKKNLLAIAIKAADNMYEFFKTPSAEKAALVYNPPQIMGLIELYRTTGNKKYLELANIFLDLMGKGRRSQTEKRLPVRDVEHVWGHAVIATYTYCGMADVYAETGDKALLQALQRLWDDATSKKMYVTGGIGSYHRYIEGNDTLPESFGQPYDLPNSTAYNETCANIGNAMWNWRMLGITGDAKYADVMEKVFYNSLLSSISLDGKSYFYTNVLEWHGKDHQLESNDAYQRWNLPRGGICCPPNALRTISEMSNYAYSISDHDVYVNLYGSNTLNTTLPDGTAVSFTQQTEYPWKGTINLTCQQSSTSVFALQMRIPGWSQGAVVKINGKVIADKAEPGKYFGINRRWNKGDVVELSLPMPVETVVSNPLVKQNLNHVAFSRGPIIYCMESKDIPTGAKLENISFSGKNTFSPVYMPSLLGGVTVLKGSAYKTGEKWDDQLYKKASAGKNSSSVSVQLVPYYSWNNRGIGEMAVWMPVINQ